MTKTNLMRYIRGIKDLMFGYGIAQLFGVLLTIAGGYSWVLLAYVFC